MSKVHVPTDIAHKILKEASHAKRDGLVSLSYTEFFIIASAATAVSVYSRPLAEVLDEVIKRIRKGGNEKLAQFLSDKASEFLPEKVH